MVKQAEVVPSLRITPRFGTADNEGFIYIFLTRFSGNVTGIQLFLYLKEQYDFPINLSLKDKEGSDLAVVTQHNTNAGSASSVALTPSATAAGFKHFYFKKNTVGLSSRGQRQR